jgi:hypothetical protein
MQEYSARGRHEFWAIHPPTALCCASATVRILTGGLTSLRGFYCMKDFGFRNCAEPKQFHLYVDGIALRFRFLARDSDAANRQNLSTGSFVLDAEAR